MPQSEISALKEKALATEIKTFAVDGVGSHVGRLVYVDEPIELSGEWVAEFESTVVAQYFKAANPQAILALIEMNEKMREALEFYKGNFDGKEGSYWLDGYKFIQEDKFGDTKHFDNGDRARQTIALFDGEVKA